MRSFLAMTAALVLGLVSCSDADASFRGRRGNCQPKCCAAAPIKAPVVKASPCCNAPAHGKLFGHSRRCCR